MAYEIESVNGCTKKIKFNFEAVDLSEQIDVAIKKKQAESNLKGFRKGKAPIDMIKKMYGPQIENDALYQFVSQQYFQTIQEEESRQLVTRNLEILTINQSKRKFLSKQLSKLFQSLR
jgi:trigger factor